MSPRSSWFASAPRPSTEWTTGRLDEAGPITRMKVLWRPLPAIAAVQHRLDAAA